MKTIPLIRDKEIEAARCAASCVVEVHRSLSDYLRAGLTLPEIDSFVANQLRSKTVCSDSAAPKPPMLAIPRRGEGADLSNMLAETRLGTMMGGHIACTMNRKRALLASSATLMQWRNAIRSPALRLISYSLVVSLSAEN